jgi:hypothetical protein
LKSWTLLETKNENSTIKLQRDTCAAYTLAPVADRIRQDVLILAGTEDHFVPIHQTADFKKALVNARSVTTRIFDRPSGGAGHCQGGALTLYHCSRFRLAHREIPRKSKGVNHTVVPTLQPRSRSARQVLFLSEICCILILESCRRISTIPPGMVLYRSTRLGASAPLEYIK